MKILSITPSFSEIIETDLPDWPTYRRYSADCWENLMGESWEAVNYPENMERLYQEVKYHES